MLFCSSALYSAPLMNDLVQQQGRPAEDDIDSCVFCGRLTSTQSRKTVCRRHSAPHSSSIAVWKKTDGENVVRKGR